MQDARIQFSLSGIGTQLKERLLAVPVYQRSYAWTTEQVTEFWGDIRAAHSERSPEYFFGTVVLTRQASPPRDSIIDGQQRFATVSILLAAIRDEYASRGDQRRRDILQRDYLSTADLATASDIS